MFQNNSITIILYFYPNTQTFVKMTKLKIFAVFALSLLMAVTVSAQSYTFKVVGSKGSNMVGGQAVKIGTQLSDDQLVEVAGDYLGLVYKDGRPLELRTKGSYKVKDLVAKLGKSSSLANKYISLVADELSQDNGASASKSRSQHMKKTGSVTRGLGTVQVLLPNRSTVYGEKIAIKWFLKEGKVKPEDVKEYVVYLTDLADQVLYTQSTKTENILIDSKIEKLKDHKIFILKVVVVHKNGSNVEELGSIDGNVITKMETEESKAIGDELATINEPSSDASALSKLIEARFFEEKELFSDAICSYEKVLELSGGLEAYNEMYKSFLYRNGMTKEAFADASEGSDKGNK